MHWNQADIYWMGPSERALGIGNFDRLLDFAKAQKIDWLELSVTSEIAFNWFYWPVFVGCKRKVRRNRFGRVAAHTHTHIKVHAHSTRAKRQSLRKAALPGRFVAAAAAAAGTAIDVAVLAAAEDAVEQQRMQLNKPLPQSIAIEPRDREKMSPGDFNSCAMVPRCIAAGAGEHSGRQTENIARLCERPTKSVGWEMEEAMGEKDGRKSRAQTCKLCSITELIQ